MGAQENIFNQEPPDFQYQKQFKEDKKHLSNFGLPRVAYNLELKKMKTW